MMRVELDYCIMHHCRFRVANRVSLEPLQASPEIQVVTLNPARTFFFQIAHAPWIRGLVCSLGRLSQGFGDCVGAQEQDPLNVSDPCADDCKRDDQVP
jgi:hypothetical protein